MAGTQAHFAQVKNWLNEIQREKTAAAKNAKAHSETGGYMGETTHVSKDVDDGLEDAKTGVRSSENEKDMKDKPFKGMVDDTSDNPGKSQEDLAYNIGVKSAPTGEMPEVEDDYKGKPSDPGTSSEMDADKIGDKYSHWVKKEAAVLSNLANDILADIATGNNIGQKQANQATPQANPHVSSREAVQAGYELASVLGLDKSSADQVTEHIVADTIKRAQASAASTGAYLVSFMQETKNLVKKAADPGSGEEGEGPPPGAGGPPPDMMPPPGGDPTGGMPPPGAGGDGPPPDMPPGGDGAPPGGDPSGGGDHAAALQELAMALMELGISPEELQQLAAGGGPGGAPPGGDAGMPPGGGAPPMPGGPADMGGKIASAVKDYKRSGRFKVTEAKTAAQQYQRNEMKRYLLEIIGAGRL